MYRHKHFQEVICIFLLNLLFSTCESSTIFAMAEGKYTSPDMKEKKRRKHTHKKPSIHSRYEQNMIFVNKVTLELCTFHVGKLQMFSLDGYMGGHQGLS